MTVVDYSFAWCGFGWVGIGVALRRITQAGCLVLTPGCWHIGYLWTCTALTDLDISVHDRS